MLVSQDIHELFPLVDGPFSYFNQGIGASADCGTYDKNTVGRSLSLNYVHSAGHSGGVGDGRTAELQYSHF